MPKSSNRKGLSVTSRKAQISYKIPYRQHWIADGVKAILDTKYAPLTDTGNDVPTLPVTEGALNALVQCHTAFLQKVGSTLIKILQDRDTEQGGDGSDHCTYVSDDHVRQAMDDIGLSHMHRLAETMGNTQAASTAPKTKTSKSKKNTWSEDQIREQERLLAQSKARVIDP